MLPLVSPEYAQLGGDFYRAVLPQPYPNNRLVHLSATALKDLGLDAETLDSNALTAILSGQTVSSAIHPIATVYSGHQFGHYVPQLGDGRALLMGDIVGLEGRRWELQLKGAGQTPYSRMGDGRAVLRSSIREYLCSEAMAALDIPTTRALALIATDSAVYREVPEPGAIVTRLAPSFIRFGHFEFFCHTGQHAQLKALADFVLTHYYPGQPLETAGYIHLFQQAVIKTAQLMAQWQAVGFCHGVMNTDNMSILGLTLDYGPFGFLDAYRAGHICNTSDHEGRYAYNQQPGIGLWNLYALAYALTPLIPLEITNQILETTYRSTFHQHYYQCMAVKLGLPSLLPHADHVWIDSLLVLLETQQVDYTGFFRALGAQPWESPEALLTTLQQHRILRETTPFASWATEYCRGLQAQPDPAASVQAMNRVNPKFVLRNHIAQQAIEAAYQGDDSQVAALYRVLIRPFEEHTGFDHLAAPPPPGSPPLCVSCSS